VKWGMPVAVLVQEILYRGLARSSEQVKAKFGRTRAYGSYGRYRSSNCRSSPAFKSDTAHQVIPLVFQWTT
jgi:hypothetical protein